MAAADLDILVHQVIRFFMREEGMSADWAFDAAVMVVLVLPAQDIDDAVELAIYRTLLPFGPTRSSTDACPY